MYEHNSYDRRVYAPVLPALTFLDAAAWFCVSLLNQDIVKRPNFEYLELAIY